MELDNEKSELETADKGAGVPRRTIVRSAAWSIPVIAAAVATPTAAATGSVVIEPGTTPSIVATCNVVGDFVFTVTHQPGGAAAPGESVTVTLPAGFSWPDDATGARSFTTDAGGVVTVSGVKASSSPGNYTVIAQVASNGATELVPVTVSGTWIGSTTPGYGGTRLYPVYIDPSSTSGLGAPDHWAYCLEQPVSARTSTVGYLGGFSAYLGSNHFAGDATVQNKVLWVLAHSYPAVSLAEFGVAAGVPGISANDAIEAAQYAIWRYTQLTWDASWNWETPDSEAAYWYLVNGANASSGNGGNGTIVSVPTSNCGTPTASDHAQTFVLVS